MKLQHQNGVFWATSSYAEKDTLKGAGFRWHGTCSGTCRPCGAGVPHKVWWTDQGRVASVLREYGDDSVVQELERRAADVELSKAASSNIEIPLPAGRQLFPFQRAGVEYALRRKHCVIADEMGLGKSAQSLAVCNAVGAKRVLVLCPASLRLNWKREVGMWMVGEPDVQVIEDRKVELRLSSPHLVVVVNYDRLVGAAGKPLHEALCGVRWDVLIADESHVLRNPKSQRSVAVLGKRAKRDPKPGLIQQADRVLLLTGTPITNRPIELFPLLEAVDPDGLGANFFRFALRYTGAVRGPYGWDFGGASNLEELQSVLRERVMVRRLKADVLKELPEKRHQVLELARGKAASLVEAQNQRYVQYEGRIQELEQAAEIAEAIGDEDAFRDAMRSLRTQQQAAFEEMSKERHAMGVAKAPMVLEHVTNVLESGQQKLVLFAWHKAVVDTLQEGLEQAGYRTVRVTGDTHLHDRQAAVDQFQQDPNIRVFIGNIQAAGVGLTLTASDMVVFAELDWVPGNMTQASDRCVIFDSMIYTMSGPKPAEDVVRGDMVMTHKGRYRKVLATFKRNYTGGFVEIEAKRHKTPLRVTYDHPVYVIGAGQRSPAWIDSQDIKLGDYLLIPRPTFERRIPDPIDLGEFINESISQRGPNGAQQISGQMQMKEFLLGHKLIDIADDRFLELLGWYAAEGYARTASAGEKTPNTWKAAGWAFCRSKETVVAEKLASFITDMFGLTAKFYASKRADSLDMRVNSTALCQLFGRLCGVGSANKQFPQWAMELPHDKLRIVFSAYLLGDGYKRVGTSPEIMGTTISPLLAQQIAEIASALGFDPALRTYPKESTNRRVINVQWTTDTKRETHDQFVLRRVTKVTHATVQRLKVVNFKVAEDESYVADRAVVHNCHRIGQRNQVLVQYLVFEGSLDARMAATLVNKQEVIEQALDREVEPAQAVVVPVAPAEEEEAPKPKQRRRYPCASVEQREAAGLAMRLLAGMCDGARTRDEAGFNRLDTNFGTELAQRAGVRPLTDGEVWAAAKLASKYKRQLDEQLVATLWLGHEAMQ